jgi:tryptophan synthase alpha chain
VRSLDEHLGALATAGKRALVIYVVGGFCDDWTDHVRAAVDAGADAIEIGIPFSDPVMDGPVIQAASVRARARGVTTAEILADTSSISVAVPFVAMTYYNLFFHRGLAASARALAEAGVTGTIVPDLPHEESEEWRDAVNAEGIAHVMMVAPSTPPERAALIARESQGFLYAAARMAVTGPGHGDGDVASVVAASRAAATVPIYAGIGIATPAQASAAAEVADGVIVGTAVVQTLLDGEGASGVARVVAAMRAALS